MMRRRVIIGATTLMLGASIIGFAVGGSYSQKVVMPPETALVAPDKRVGPPVLRPAPEGINLLKRPSLPTRPSSSARFANPLWKIPLASLRATRERPLFSPSRRAPLIATPSVETAPVVTGPHRPALSLLGTIIGKAEAIAILLDETTNVVVRLKPGESHAGWELRSVKGREATLEKDHQAAILTISTPPG
jgi:general secretion pathway protein N